MFRASQFLIGHEMAGTCKVKVTRTSVITHLVHRIGEEDEEVSLHPVPLLSRLARAPTSCFAFSNYQL